MGAFRLLLAALVAISHMGVTFAGFNPGVIAVISFLLISGFVMTSLIERNYNALAHIPSFYVDRLLRLYPQFLLYFVASCAVIYVWFPGTPQAAALTVKNIVLSLAIVPLDLYMYGVTVPQVLPAAWSLGLEMCFYLLIPFLLIYKLRGLAFALSVLVFMVASLGYIDTDVYGYRLLPGVLFIFICGSYLYRMRARGAVIAAATAIVAALMFAAIVAGLIPRLPFNAEVTAGIALGVPAVLLLSKLKYHRLDELLGNISYGVFLNHFVVMYFVRGVWPTAFNVHTVLVLSFLLSGVSYYLVERPALKLRHALRAGGASAVGREVRSGTAA